MALECALITRKRGFAFTLGMILACLPLQTVAQESCFQIIDKISLGRYPRTMKVEPGCIDEFIEESGRRNELHGKFGHHAQAYFGLLGIADESVYAAMKFVQLYENTDEDFLNGIPRLKIKYPGLEFAQYRYDYANATNRYAIEKFINNYSANDPDNLMPATKQKLAQMEKEAEKEAQAEKKEAAIKQAKVNAWRKKLKIGDSTFCGEIIEIRSPMVRIALNAPLEGYPGEAWLNTKALYPDWAAGCRNINGRLEAVF